MVGDGVPGEDDWPVAGVGVRVAEAEDGAVAAVPVWGASSVLAADANTTRTGSEKRGGAHHQEARVACPSRSQ